MYKIVLIRHGQTTYNRDKIFCGWTDAPLTEKGIYEAKTAGKKLKEALHRFDIGFVSLLTRAQHTLHLALAEMGQSNLPLKETWRLNERHYGALQDQRHEDIKAKHSPEQVQIWRRSFNIKPPQLDMDDPRHPSNDARYAHMDRSDLPAGESLENTIDRVLPYWHSEIVPEIKKGKKIIISASGNSLRALIKHIEKIDDEGIVGLELPNGVPMIYTLDKDLNFIEKHYLHT